MAELTTQKTATDDNVRTLSTSISSQTGTGFLHLKQYLKEMSLMRHALNTGRPLLFCLRDQDKLLPHLPKKTTPPTETSADEDTARICTMSMQQNSMDPAEEEILRRIKFRKQEHIIEKLQWIYQILCGLTNMRNRDLKTLVPLTSGYMSIIMKDTEKTNVLLKNSQKCLITSAPEDCQNINSDLWETFINHQDPELKSPSAKFAGCKTVHFGLRRKAGLKELENETGDLPPWLSLLLDENPSYEKNPQKPKNSHDMLERVKTEFMDFQRSINNKMESDILEKKIHRDERMRTLLDALMASRKETSLPMLLSSLKHKHKEPKTSSVFWYQILQKEASELAEDRDLEYRNIMKNIAQFRSFSHKKIPYCKEKFCLLVLSLPANQLLRSAMQDALMFLTENLLQLLPRQLKHWFQYLKLPFYDATL